MMTEAEARSRSCHYPGAAPCRASDCMAWRWQPLACGPEWRAAVHKRAFETGEKAPLAKAARYVNENRAEVGLPDRPFLGYCGLAGKPET